jgi:hypothetical protein
MREFSEEKIRLHNKNDIEQEIVIQYLFMNNP